jgi:hypothetical protein
MTSGVGALVSSRRLWFASLGAVLLAAVFVLSALTPLGGVGSSASQPAHAAPTTAVPTASVPLSDRLPTLPHSVPTSSPASPPLGPMQGTPGTPAPGGSAVNSPAPPSPPSSGRGSFFTTTTLPGVASPTPLGYGPSVNDTTSPSIAVSSHGDAVLAYTAYTNDSPCANASQYAFTEIGVVISSNNGSTWSSPTYLGNPDCTQVYNYTGAWEPSVAVLANGTFAMAYIEYNTTWSMYGCAECLPEDIYPNYYYYDRLVITYSYNGGSTWTMPFPVNTSANPSLNSRSWMPIMPQLAAFGQTLYLVWENYTNPEFYYDSSTGLNLVVSTNGGATWSNLSAPTQLPVQPGTYYSEYWWSDNNPSLLVTPSGELFVAYTSNYTEAVPPVCQPYACTTDYYDSLNVVVASSTNNGSSFSVHTVARAVPWEEDSPGYGFVSVQPELAYDAVHSKLYVAYEGFVFSTTYFTDPTCTGCQYFDAPTPWISVSSNHGTTWSTPQAASLILDNPYGGVYNINTNLGIAVNSTGAVFISDLFTNDTVCGVSPTYGYECGLTSEVMLISTDHGSTFTGPYDVNTDATLGAEYWAGIGSVFATLGGNLTVAWTNPSCPGYYTTGLCYWVNGFGSANISLSQQFEGVGVTVTFNETGLPGGNNWTVTLTGNARSGSAGANLAVSGVPTGTNEIWTASWVNTTYGHAWGSSVISPTSPGLISGPTIIDVTYEQYVQMLVFTVPPAQSTEAFSCPTTMFSFAEFCANQVVNPAPGSHWVQLGATVPYNVTTVAFAYFCDYCYNYSFLSWTGIGQGSWNTTNPNGTTVVNGPVNETASFNFLSTCDQFGTVTPTCYNATYDYLFQETGLPANTTWTVTLGNQTASSTNGSIVFPSGPGPYNFTVWNVPFNATLSWVGTPNYASPITAFQGAIETVHFALMPNADLFSGVSFGARGLPAGVTSWNLVLNGTSYGIPISNATFTLGSGNYTLDANPVYGSDGVGAYITEFAVTPLVVNGTGSTVLPGGNLTVNGPSRVTAEFAPEYYVTVSSSAGGMVTPSSVGWVPASAPVLLTATPAANNAFVGWTGTGSGSVTGTTAAITVTPNAPVTEFATFTQVTPTYDLQVTAHGIQSGVPVTLGVGTQTYTELAPFQVSGLTAGEYAISLPTVYPNGTVGVRYDLTGVTPALTDGSLDITQNGTISLTYAVSYDLTVTPAINGTTTPGAGSFWESGAASVPLTATPLSGHSFADWVGTGPGSYSGPNPTISLNLTGAVTESAYFSTNPYIPPATYTVTVTETGLPTGLAWSASIGSQGASGPAGATGASLVLSGLNGSYEVSVPIVAGTAGVRYMPTYTANVTATSKDATVSVTFVTQYEVTVSTSAGGAATASAQWVIAGTSVTLTATANASSTFVNWSGTGTGSYTGTSASTTVTVSNPIAELANFVPTSSLHSSSGGSGGGASWLLAIGLLVVLLVVGLIVGLVIGRSRPPSAGGSSTSAEPEADTSNVPVWTERSETTETPPPSPAPAPGSNEEESIYGGGSA